jgi:flagellar hook-basal body complex protein FliE
MVVNELAAGKQYLPIVQQRTSELELPRHDGVTFKDTLSELVDDVNSLQVDAAEQKEKLIKGEPVDLCLSCATKVWICIAKLCVCRSKFILFC